MKREGERDRDFFDFSQVVELIYYQLVFERSDDVMGTIIPVMRYVMILQE